MQIYYIKYEIIVLQNSDWTYLSQTTLYQEGFTARYARPNCVYLEKSGIPIFLTDLLIFRYWESHCNSAGTTLLKFTAY